MRVIFAADDPAARTLLTAVLEELGHEAVGYEDGERAWESYRSEPALLVILDLELPIVDGLELCRRIRALDAGDPPFILIATTHDDPARLKAVLDAGADDFVAKPSSPKNLRARIEIAERRLQQAAALQAARSDLARARWLAGIGETALAMEREISGPLQAILERASRLLEDATFDDDQRDQLRIISEQGARLAGVVGRAVSLESPQSVEYFAGARMIDLSEGQREPEAMPLRETHEATRDRNGGAGAG